MIILKEVGLNGIKESEVFLTLMNNLYKKAGAVVGIFGLVLGISSPAAAKTIYAQCDTYINIHDSYTFDSQCIGKIYNGNVAQVLSESVDKYYISSGNVKGWVDKSYFTEQPVNEGYTTATIYPQLLNVRSAPSQDSQLFGAVYQGQQIEAIDYKDGWVTLAFEDGTYGYVSGEYVSLNTYYGTAESTEEQLLREEQEYEAYLAEQQMLYQEYLNNQTYVDNGVQEDYPYFDKYQEEENYDYSYYAGTGDVSTETSYNNETYEVPETTQESVPETNEASITDSSPAPAASSATGSGQYLSDYAKQYIGNPYVYGGESLSTGADCSGFTKAVMNANGITVNGRTAADQAAGGTQIPLDQAQAGDLIYYNNGSGVYHIAIYNGDGTVTHSSNSTTGVTVSDMNYSGNAAGAVRYW